MRKVKILSILLLFVLTSFLFQDVVLAVPPLPSSFYGEVSLNGSNVAEGTLIEALINDTVVGESQTLMYQGQSVYTIDVNGDDSGTLMIEGGKEGDAIKYRVGGLLAIETGTWHSGVNFELNLTISAQGTLQPPEPTKTPIPTQTPIKNPTKTATKPATVQPTQRPTQTPAQNQANQPTATTQAAQPTAVIATSNPTSMAIIEDVEQTPVLQAEQSSNTSSNSIAEESGGENAKILEKQESPNYLLPELIVVIAVVILIVAGYSIIKNRNQRT